jgi:hypothetical protein
MAKIQQKINFPWPDFVHDRNKAMVPCFGDFAGADFCLKYHPVEGARVALIGGLLRLMSSGMVLF